MQVSVLHFAFSILHRFSPMCFGNYICSFPVEVATVYSDVLVEKQLIVNSMDVFAVVGGFAVAYELQTTRLCSDRAMSIELVSQVGIPMLSGVEVVEIV